MGSRAVAASMSSRAMQAVPMLLAAMVVHGLFGCQDILGPRIPSEAVALDPLPPEYQGWWDVTERCSGLVGDLGDVRWFVLPGMTSVPGTDGAVGSYSHAGNHVLLADGFERDGSLVRHEMLHALLRGTRGHPRDFFVERCGGVVGCGAECLEDAGTTPAWDLSSPVVEPEALSMIAEVMPLPIRFPAQVHGCTSIAVTIGNAGSGSVAVDVDQGRAQLPHFKRWLISLR
jgi:hypothetical protein